VFDREELDKVLAFADRGLLKPHPAKTFPVAQVQDAFELLEGRDFYGKILLRP
jgi:D-arabinose 1-dehydrogenase-like Zn-dependent alcohol dehydrogenase